MTRKQLNDVVRTDIIEYLITMDDLENKKDRILISGYTCDRSTFITELNNGDIETYIEDFFSKNRVYVNIEYNSHYVPTKRVYPHKSDYEFCKLLRERGVIIPFTTFE